MYPAIDLGAGEKERLTLETLLLCPASRTEIALGKFFVIFAAAIIASVLGVVSMAVSLGYIVPEGVLELAHNQPESGVVGQPTQRALHQGSLRGLCHGSQEHGQPDTGLAVGTGKRARFC